MRVVLWGGGSSGNMGPVDELAERVRATGAGEWSLDPSRMSLSGVAFAGGRR